MHLPNTVFKPPTVSAVIKPSTYKISASKYGINYLPAVATKYLMSDVFYASAQWY